MIDSYDSPWKDGLTEFFRPFLALFLPEIDKEVDWSSEITPLDTELRKIAREAELGVREADILVQVKLRDGQPGWFFIHVEVQVQQVQDFAERMLIYHYRIRDRFGGPVCSLGLLGDPVREWRPNLYRWERFGCRLEFEFPIIKLADYRGRMAELEASTNPFAVIVAAHLWTQDTRDDADRRLEIKLRPIRSLFHRGLSKEDIIRLFRLVDWLLQLEPPQSLQFLEKLANYEKEDKVPYISTVEQMGIQKGLEKGLEQGRRTVLDILETRFGQTAGPFEEELRGIGELDRLRHLAVEAVKAQSPEDFGARLKSSMEG